MSKFLTPLCDHQIGPRLWQLDGDLQYVSDLGACTITVPKGFQTDYESCPVWLPIINSLFGNIVDEAAVLHDWLYYAAIFNRETSDKILVEAMDTIPGLAGWRKQGIYIGLRLGGWHAWNQHRASGHNINSLRVL